jgi:hypothetical protein
MKNLGGWARLGIVLTLLWTLAVLVELSFEVKHGPFSLQLLTETVVARTGEPVSALDGNQFRDLVPVDQVVKIEKLLSALLVPILSMWIWVWRGRGFVPALEKRPVAMDRPGAVVFKNPNNRGGGFIPPTSRRHRAGP